MKPSSCKDKGRAWENEACEFLQANGAPHAERRRLTGSKDRGDLSGVPGVVFECKHEKAYKPVEWIREADVEAVNDGGSVGVVFARQLRRPGGENGIIMMSPATLMRLLKEAGYL